MDLFGHSKEKDLWKETDQSSTSATRGDGGIYSNLEDLASWDDALRTQGVDLVVLDQAIDTTTSAGRAMFGMLAVFAEFERDLIRERVVGGLQRAKALGKRIGRPPSQVDRAQVLTLRDAGGA